VDNYIADLRASTELEMDLEIFRMHRLGLPQERIANRLSVPQRTLSDHLAKMPSLAIPLNADLSKGFTVPQVAEKHSCPACPVAPADGTGVGPEDRTGGWTEPMVWSLALEGKEDLQRFKALNWGLRTWDLWNWNDCLPREIHVNDSEAYFTGVTNVSETIIPVASRLK
jgi:hypothetical protein